MASLSELTITCRGCLEDQPGQMAHMGIGGCLYVGPDMNDNDELNHDLNDELNDELNDYQDEYQHINSDKIYYLMRMIYWLLLELKNSCTRD